MSKICFVETDLDTLVIALYVKIDDDAAGLARLPGRPSLLVLATTAANRDERAYPEPDRFDISRELVNPHVGFGYAIHYCLGASLARVELRTVFSSLFQRFPTLRLAVPYEA